MPAFSKPVLPSAGVETTQTRKRTINPKLLSEDNVHADAVKRRKLEQAKSGNPTTSGMTDGQPRNTTLIAKKSKGTPKPKPKIREPSAKDTAEDIYMSTDAGHPKKTNANVEAADGTGVIDLDDDEPEVLVVDDSDKEEEEVDIQEETDEQELGNVKIQSWYCFINLLFRTTSKRMALTDLCIFQTPSGNQLRWWPPCA